MSKDAHDEHKENKREMKETKNETATYAQMGMAALLPGMVHMLDVLQRHVDEFRRELDQLQNGASVKLTNRAARAKSKQAKGWSDDPAERSAEMRRRMQVRLAKKATHPRDPNHPGHEEWSKKVSAASKSRWKKMTVAQRKARLDAMAAGKLHDVKKAVA